MQTTTDTKHLAMHKAYAGNTKVLALPDQLRQALANLLTNAAQAMRDGGTLTDACVIHGAKVFRAKTLTTPHDLTQCFVQVLKEASKRVYGEEKLAALLEEVDYIRYSTTQGTNALVFPAAEPHFSRFATLHLLILFFWIALHQLAFS